MDHLGGPIERAMINAAVSQMAQHFELPLYSTAGTTDSTAVDVQAAYESAMSSLLVAMSGANYIHDIAGLMESDLTVSYDKLVLDNETLGMCQRVLRGIEVDDDTLATDLMIEKGPGTDYMADPHTVRYMRSEFFEPTVTNRTKRESQDHGDDALSQARKRVAEVRAMEHESRIPDEVRAQILDRFPAIWR
jgi:trimethylamine--corrinoid protein Co-methyltransferase